MRSGNRAAVRGWGGEQPGEGSAEKRSATWTRQWTWAGGGREASQSPAGCGGWSRGPSSLDMGGSARGLALARGSASLLTPAALRWSPLFTRAGALDPREFGRSAPSRSCQPLGQACPTPALYATVVGYRQGPEGMCPALEPGLNAPSAHMGKGLEGSPSTWPCTEKGQQVLGSKALLLERVQWSSGFSALGAGLWDKGVVAEGTRWMDR